MAEDLARAGLYALRAIMDGLRDVGLLDQSAIRAIETRTEMGVNLAGALEVTGSGDDAEEARVMRHGMWIAREAIAPTGDFQDKAVIDHPRDSQAWPKLEERQPADEDG